MKEGFMAVDGQIMGFDELETRIRAEVAAAKAEGWVIVRGVYFERTEPPRCCPIGALVRNGATLDKRMSIDELSWRAIVPCAARQIFGLDQEATNAIASGVDGFQWRSPGQTSFYDLGTRLRDLLDEP